MQFEFPYAAAKCVTTDSSNANSFHFKQELFCYDLVEEMPRLRFLYILPIGGPHSVPLYCSTSKSGTILCFTAAGLTIRWTPFERPMVSDSRRFCWCKRGTSFGEDATCQGSSSHEKGRHTGPAILCPPTPPAKLGLIFRCY